MDWHPIDELAFPVHVHDGQLLDVRQSAEDTRSPGVHLEKVHRRVAHTAGELLEERLDLENTQGGGGEAKRSRTWR